MTLYLGLKENKEDKETDTPFLLFHYFSLSRNRLRKATKKDFQVNRFPPKGQGFLAKQRELTGRSASEKSEALTLGNLYSWEILWAVPIVVIRTADFAD